MLNSESVYRSCVPCVSNDNVFILQRGNIAEALLKEGFARCVDWSMVLMKTGADKLRLAEKLAKEARIRIWKDYQATGPQVGYFDTNFFYVNSSFL
jgi:endonuclease YncB( thermonuclease family)